MASSSVHGLVNTTMQVRVYSDRESMHCDSLGIASSIHMNNMSAINFIKLHNYTNQVVVPQ